MTTLKVKEMSCNHCVGRIGKVLTDAGIAHTIQLEDKTVTIEDSNNVAKAIEEMDDIGFTAEEE
ncbi:MAG TPA: metal-binding protein [Lachnospiraceae bacterium]|uniref:heavy-metal-associated domain-containing protein n=1 Tax=Anaerosporobacter sp. TaxID=1872529 RepID=UPI000ED4F487|nr:heavy-metal-associated domain-containing protein [Anaerosporobacter sp.]MBS5931350.1 heavy-metal-associated domain-containing protein [Clostridiales bacterium]HAB62447.1 metal-binding protein [Lachnospiraceae bacterium]